MEKEKKENNNQCIYQFWIKWLGLAKMFVLSAYYEQIKPIWDELRDRSLIFFSKFYLILVNGFSMVR